MNVENYCKSGIGVDNPSPVLPAIQTIKHFNSINSIIMRPVDNGDEV
jgi:hypothetical protein